MKSCLEVSEPRVAESSATARVGVIVVPGWNPRRPVWVVVGASVESRPQGVRGVSSSLEKLMSLPSRTHGFQILRFLGLPVAFLGLLTPGTVLAKQPNILFIAVDDLRPQLGCYGQNQIVSPNIDRLASQGVLFERAYCMVPTCGASRASLFTSVRPARNRFVAYTARADEEAPWAVTLNSHFKKHGYHTVSNGKVFHFPNDSEEGWSEPPWRPDRSGGHYVLEKSLRRQAANARIKNANQVWLRLLFHRQYGHYK